MLICCLLLGAAGRLAAQANMACCAASATEVYAMNAADKNFASKHDELPFHYSSENGKDISYPTADGQTAHAGGKSS